MSEVTKNPGSAARSGGLEGTLVADTVLSDVDGENGRLVLRGHSVEGLAPRASLEAVAALLWHGAAPDDRPSEARARTAFADARCAPSHGSGTSGARCRSRTRWTPCAQAWRS